MAAQSLILSGAVKEYHNSESKGVLRIIVLINGNYREEDLENLSSHQIADWFLKKLFWYLKKFPG